MFPSLHSGRSLFYLWCCAELLVTRVSLAHVKLAIHFKLFLIASKDKKLRCHKYKMFQGFSQHLLKECFVSL